LADPRDVLLLRVPLPAVAGTRLRETLPGLVEEHLIRDAEHCHIAVLARHPDGQATLAVTGAAWLGLLLEAFGRRRLRLLPAALCLPASGHAAGAVAVEPAPAAVPPAAATEAGADNAPATGSEAHHPCWLLTVRQPDDGAYGIVLAPDEALAWLRGPLAGAALYAGETLLSQLPAGREARAAGWPLWIAGARALPQMDACQFALAANSRGGAPGTASLAWPLSLALAAVLLSLAGVNAQWWTLQRQHNALAASMHGVLREHFPKAGPIVDAPAQMWQQLDLLRQAKGQPAPGDFAVLADRFAQALAPVPLTAVSELDYRERSLRVRFGSASGNDIRIDAQALRTRLENAGLNARVEDGQWILRSRT
ncbi:type II secretion system protein GspL, partial [Cupriavidus basilensis]